MSDLVQARWKCGYSVDLAGRGTVHPGDVVEIPAGEAWESDNWEPLEPADSPLDLASVDLTTLLVADLRMLASEVGITGVKSMTKDQLIAALTELAPPSSDSPEPEPTATEVTEA